jgi:signal transduction histidine kinase
MALLAFLAGPGFVLGQEPTTSNAALPLLTSISQIRQLTPEQAALGYPVRLQATVTFHNQHRDCFVMDGPDGVFVTRKRSEFCLKPGQLVDLEGVTAPGDYAPLVREKQVRVFGENQVPVAIPVSFDQLASGQMDCQFVEAQGIIRLAFRVGGSHLQLQLAVGEGELRAYVYDYPEVNTAGLVDAVVRVRGAVGGRFNQKRQLVAPLLFVYGTNNVILLRPAPAEPFGVPVRPVRSLLQFDPQGQYGHRAKVRGVVTYHRSGQSLFIRDQAHGLYIQTSESLSMQPGDVIEALGFAVMGPYTPYLRQATFRRVGRNAAPLPIKTEAAKILEGENDADLVTIEAHLLDQMQRGDERVLVLQTGNLTFNAYLAEAKDAPAWAVLQGGSRLQLTGICRIHEVTERISKFTPRAFHLLLRSPQDILVLKSPPWWTPHRLLWVLLGMTVVFMVAVGWVLMLKRKVAQQTQIIRQRLHRETALEERTRIARELHDTLEQELAGIAIQLDAVAAKWSDSPQLAGKSLEIVRRMVRRSQAEARRSVWDLRSLALENSDLTTAISEIASQGVKGLPVEIQMIVHGTASRLPGPVENHLLRISQEAVANSTKHGGCKQIRIELNYEPDKVRLCIRDNGRGFDPALSDAGRAGHFGLLGMRERADKIGGTLSLQSSIGIGTEVLVEVPLAHDNRREVHPTDGP